MSLDNIEEKVLIERCKKGNYEIPENLESAEALRECVEMSLTATMEIPMDSEVEFELATRFNTYNQFVELYGGNLKSIKDVIKN